MPSITLNYSAEDGQRVAKAVGYVLHQPGNFTVDPVPATAQEIKGLIIAHIIQLVQRSEHAELDARSNVPPDPILT